MLGFAAPLVAILETGNFVVFIEGESGVGKSTINYIALSLYGYYKSLKLTMNLTDNALEAVLKQRRDTFICLDEINTSSKDITTQLVRAVYSVEAEVGRARMTKDYTLGELAMYRGIVGITSEESFSTFIEAMERIVNGARRRVVVIDVSSFEERVDKSFFTKVYQNIGKNYGHLIVDWIEYIKSHREELERSYKQWLETLRDENRGYEFNGPERYFALLFTTAEHVGKAFGIGYRALDRVFEYLWKICDANDDSQKEALKVYTREGLQELLLEFVEAKYGNFEVRRYKDNGEQVEEITTQFVRAGEVYGLIVPDLNYLYLTSAGKKAFVRYVKVQEKVVTKLLINFGFAEPNQGKSNQKMKRTTTTFASGVRLNTYCINLDLSSFRQDSSSGLSNNKKGGGKGGGQDSNGASSNGASDNKDAQVPDYYTEHF
ncbi:MAG: DUF927 domain-containing protein [Aquificota bacterium]|nr:MAG: DUF927 domain-containing protein [Aquificota bacterium]